MIKTFKCRQTERLFHDENVPRFANIQRAARRKLQMINAARLLIDLKVPPGNKLHALDDDREGQHSISINNQWRICFVWNKSDAYDVEIVDYH